MATVAIVYSFQITGNIERTLKLNFLYLPSHNLPSLIVFFISESFLCNGRSNLLVSTSAI